MMNCPTLKWTQASVLNATSSKLISQTAICKASMENLNHFSYDGEFSNKIQKQLKLLDDPLKKVINRQRIDEGSNYYFMTELHYRMALAQEPENPLLLANFAHFLYSFTGDYLRAVEYFKKATAIEPKDAEACYKYANFLWNEKNDLVAAEDTYLDAISADPDNSFYQSTYANFLWSTGGKDTCFPLDQQPMTM